jgi:acetolactate synthase-1/2/3 large subunit
VTEPSLSAAQDIAVEVSGHGGYHAVAAARAHDVASMYTLSGAHVFPLYDAAINVDPPMRLVDVRHEQTAVFAAEAEAKLRRRPGLAVVTAGPGVTNSISGVAAAAGSGVPLLVLGGRAPAGRWGTGALQELDHPPLLAPLAKSAATAATPADVGPAVSEALTLASTPRRGPVFVDVPMDALYTPSEGSIDVTTDTAAPAPESGACEAVAERLAAARRPVVVLGSGVWMAGAEAAARTFAEETQVPVVPQGMGRGILGSGHRLLASQARSIALGDADLVIVVGTPLDFRLGYGRFGDPDQPTPVVHVVESASELATHVGLAGSLVGELSAALDGVASSVATMAARPEHERARRARGEWLDRLAEGAAETAAEESNLMQADTTVGVHPARLYGELTRIAPAESVMIGDGGDFVSWAGKLVDPQLPGTWLDPGPFGCLGAGLGAAVGAAVCSDVPPTLLLGDGAAGMSLMDADTLVRHRLPVVMIVGNNGAWGLEKFPMRFLYGYDVAAELRQDTRYDSVVAALGGAGETVASATDLPAALRRAYDSGVPYLINVLLDPEVAYPRKTTGV